MNSGGVGGCSGVAGGGTMLSPKSPQAALASIYDRLANLTDRVEDNAETTALTAARAIGPSAPTNGSGGTAPPGGAPAQPDDVASKFGQLLTRLEHAIDRQGRHNDRINNFV